ncbi:MAG: sulfite oxidase [Chloroflexi bacterium]|nr:sulfite oxidase [Chloroflexota bacterium]
MPLSEKHDETKTYDDILNAGPPLSQLARDFVTPTHLFFVRNHSQIPHLQLDTYRLRVSGMVTRELALSLDQIKSDFDSHSLTATLQCAGNRRKELVSYKPIDEQLAWDIEAIGTAEWTGVRLGNVLAAAGISGPDAAHVAFLGLDTMLRDGEREAFGSSIPLDKALGTEVLLAYAMNGEDLPLAHGCPLRVIVPGYIGARSVKWLSEIRVQDCPSDNHFQQVGYKLFPPHINMYNVDYSDGMQLTKLPVNSVIVRPQDRSLLPAGALVVEGYAMSDGEHEITWISVSPDGGETWQRAEFLNKPQLWTWQLWRAEFDLPVGQHEIVVRAWDSAANSQPETIASVWNFKGYVNNAWHRVKITLK